MDEVTEMNEIDSTEMHDRNDCDEDDEEDENDITTIPYKIHQIWFQGEENLPEKYKVFQKTWTDQELFEYEIWDETKIIRLLHDQNSRLWDETGVHCKKLYNSYPTMIQKIDFAKYVILYVYGGIYIDMDVFAIRDLSIFMKKNNKNALLVFPHNVPRTAVTMSKALGLRGNLLINNAVIFTQQGSNEIRTIIESCYTAQRGWLKNVVVKQLRCLVTTGPIVFTNSVRSLENWDEYVKPIETFEPYTNLEIHTTAKLLGERYEEIKQVLKTDKALDDTYGIHVFDVNWMENGKRHWRKRLLRQLYKRKS